MTTCTDDQNTSHSVYHPSELFGRHLPRLADPFTSQSFPDG
jgi:hypothetical protein